MTKGVRHYEGAETDYCRRLGNNRGRLYSAITCAADVAIDSERAGIAVIESHVTRDAESQSECSAWITATEHTTSRYLAAMPDRKTLDRARADKKAGKAPSTQAGEFIREEM